VFFYILYRATNTMFFLNEWKHEMDDDDDVPYLAFHTKKRKGNLAQMAHKKKKMNSHTQERRHSTKVILLYLLVCYIRRCDHSQEIIL
jgi:hypothetical protein